MSNHWHGVVSDPEARLPQFLQELHRLIAKAQNTWLNRRENFWSSERTSVVRLATDADVLAKMAYTIANPTSAMLVESPDQWPGVISDWSVPQPDAEMPDVFFDKSGDLPKQIPLKFERPQIFAHLTDAQLLRTLTEQVAVLVERAHCAIRDAKACFVGVRAVLSQSFDSKPKSEESFGALNPSVGAKSRAVRVRVIQSMRAFLDAYRAAWLRWRDGARDTIFPAGTYALRLYSGVRCAPA